MARLMISISGVRGIIGASLTPEIVLQFAQAFGTHCNSQPVVVGRDSRVSGEMLHRAVLSGLLSVGNPVIDIGICPTPTTQFTTKRLDAAGGIMITASHNPIMWNGIKMLAEDGLFLDDEQGSRVLKIREEKDYYFQPWDKLGHVEKYEKAAQAHLDAVLNLPFIDIEKIRRRKLKVVTDCINGAGAVIIPELLTTLGCETILINGSPDGRFARTPEPLPENLGEVTRAVREQDADLGVVVDPDSDRLAIVSEKGLPLGEEYTLALAAFYVLQQRKGKVVINVSTSRVIDDVAEKYGCTVERTRVGEINVTKRMKANAAVFGGEGNGGVILPDIHLGRDAIAGIAIILQLLAEAREPISAIHAGLPQYQMVKGKIDLADDTNPAQIIDILKDKYANEQLDLTDGLKIMRNRSWVHIRASNTEPIIRILAEAPTLESAKLLATELTNAIRSC